MKPAILQGTGRRIGKVAFAAEQPYYRVAFGIAVSGRAFNDSGDLQEHSTPGPLRGTEPPKPGDWLPSDWLSGGWSLKPLPDGTLQLFHNGAAQGKIDLASAEFRAWMKACRDAMLGARRDGQAICHRGGHRRAGSIYVCILDDAAFARSSAIFAATTTA